MVKIESRLLTVSQAAEKLSVHANTVRRWNNRGLIESVRTGSLGHRRFSDDKINELTHGKSTSLTIKQVATELFVHVNTVRRWSNCGILKSFRIGPRGDRRFGAEDIENFKHGKYTDLATAEKAKKLRALSQPSEKLYIPRVSKAVSHTSPDNQK
jgi:excisionase family DNA binding protein